MSYLPENLVQMDPDKLSGEFWDRCQRGELAFQRCAACLTFRHPPAPLCYVCKSPETWWVAVPGSGSVYTYTIVVHPVHPALSEYVPYNIVLIEFTEAPGVRLVSNVIDIDPADLTVGLPVDLAWQSLYPEFTVPRFKRAEIESVSYGCETEESRSGGEYL